MPFGVSFGTFMTHENNTPFYPLPINRRDNGLYMTGNEPYFPRQFSIDAAIRYAVSDENDNEKFKKLAENFFNAGMPTVTQIMYIAMILYKRNKYEMLDIFIDALHETDTENLKADNIDMTRIKTVSDIVQKCIFEHRMPEDQYTEHNFMEDLIYFSMITGNTEAFKKYAKDGVLWKESHFYLMSAIAFGDSEFLKIMFDSVEELYFDMRDIAFFCIDDRIVKYLCSDLVKNIFKYRYKNNDISIQKFIQRIVRPHEMLRFAYELRKTVSSERFAEIFKGLPKINFIRESETWIIEEFISDDSIDIRTVFSDVAVWYEIDDGTEFMDMDFPDVPDMNFIYDFTRTDEKCFRQYKTSKIIKFLKTKTICTHDSFLTELIADLLDRNHEELTKVLISRLIINKENLDDTIEYLTVNKLYNALNAVNRSEIHEIPDLFEEEEE